jgi:hypothetical protein
MSARFESILFRQASSGADVDEPEFAADLNLDRVRTSIRAGREEYDLDPFFHAPLRDVDAVAYRHEVFRDLEQDAVASAVRGFGEEMRRARSYLTLARKQHYRYETERWFLDAASVYCDAVEALSGVLATVDLRSRGLRTLREYLVEYTSCERFGSGGRGAHGARGAGAGQVFGAHQGRARHRRPLRGRA